jgi:hypothetical protein
LQALMGEVVLQWFLMDGTPFLLYFSSFICHLSFVETFSCC